MSESATNTTNMPQTTQAYSVESKSVKSTVTQNTQTKTKTKVDMTATQGTVDESQVNDKPQKRFDTNNMSFPAAYAQRYLSGINKTPTFQKNQNDDEFLFGPSLSNPESTTLSFKNDFITQAENRTSFEKSKNLFATLDNENFKYGRLFFQGSWINTRTPIDPATGEATGLPEMLPA